MCTIRKISLIQLAAATLLTLPISLAAQERKKDAAPAARESSRPEIDYKSVGAPMPEIRGVYPGKAVYTTKDLKNDANLIVMLFNPTCEHCEQLTLELEKHIELFKKSNLLLLAAPGMGAYLEYFQNNTHVDQYPHIMVALDSSDFIQRTFRYESLPQVNVYSPAGKLLQVFSGLEAIDRLKPYIQ